MLLKSIFNETEQFFEALNIYDFYKAYNLAIDELNGLNFIQEVSQNIAADVNGEIDLSSLTNEIRKVLSLKDSDNYSLQPTSKEYVQNFADPDEKCYAQVGETLYVNAPIVGSFQLTDLTFTAPNLITYTGTLENFWAEHEISENSSIVISGADTAANNDTFTVSDVNDRTYSGKYDGSSGIRSLADSTASFPIDGTLIGKTIYNRTKNASGVIIANTATTIVAQMYYIKTGDSASWDAGDAYEIIYYSGNILELNTELIETETPSGTVSFTISSLVFYLHCYQALPKFTEVSTTAEAEISSIYLPALKYLSLYNLYSTNRYQNQKAQEMMNNYRNQLPNLYEYMKKFKEL